MLSYESPERLADAPSVRAVEAALDGVPWTRLTWRRSALRDFAAGLRGLRRAASEHAAELVHARGYVPAFLASRLGLPFLFDMRGFWPDERADGGLWRRGGVSYRIWKRIERRLCRDAQAIVVLTERARDELRRLNLAPREASIHVIPTCADLDRFRPLPASERVPEAAGPRRFVILGGTGTWYLGDEMLDLAARALSVDIDAEVHVLTTDDAEPIRAGLARRGVAEGRCVVRRVAHDDVPRWISGAVAGLVLVRPTWSKGASCPTKVAELLGCGVPLLVNRGVGDLDGLLADAGVAVVVESFDAPGYDAALADLVTLHAGAAAGGVSARCRSLAERELDVSRGAARYAAAYDVAGRER